MADRAKPHRCTVCERRFARLEHLKRHTTTHTNEKSFRCFCGKAFSRRDLLRRHERIGRHAITGPNSSADAALDQYASGDESLALDEAAVSQQPSLSYDGDWFDSGAFQNFDAFISTMGLNAPFDNVLSGDYEQADAFQSQSAALDPSQRLLTPPDVDPESVHELKRIPSLWTVTQRQRDVLDTALQPYRTALLGFLLPSSLALTRYLTGYMEDFQDHQPILHTATYRPQESKASPELMLAICACGALTRYERPSAIRLFGASKAIVETEWARRNAARRSAEDLQSEMLAQVDSSLRDLQRAQAAMLLSTFAIMEGKHGLIHDAASLHCLLVEYVRDHGMETARECEDWRDWIFEESARRTQCAIFNILNMHTMALDSVPALSIAQLKVYLPCSTPEWIASNREDWSRAKQHAPSPVAFSQAYAALFDTTAPLTYMHAPLGSLVLINAILQRIYLARQMQVGDACESLRQSDLDEVELALDRWTHTWKQAPESILDPRNPDASNSFTSTSYLGLAYVRLHTTYGARRRLDNWQPKMTGCSLHRAPLPGRSSRLDSALLHAAQAFAIPVRFGIEYMGRKQFHYWDLQNFIWHLEAAVFLAKWLRSVAETCAYSPLSDFESRLILVVKNLVEKAEESVNPNLVQPVEGIQDTVAVASSLARRIAQLWSRLYEKQNSPWGLVDMIGQSLAEFELQMAA